MKLSKSKLALAKVINENGGWKDESKWAAQDKRYYHNERNVCFYDSIPTRPAAGATSWSVVSGSVIESFEADLLLPNWHRTLLSREEYYQAYPKADADGWIEWKGGKYQISDDSLVDVKLRSGEARGSVLASEYDWRHGYCDIPTTSVDIIAYRLHKPDVKPEFCESVMRSIPEPKPFKCSYDQKLISLANVRIVDESTPDSEENFSHRTSIPRINQCRCRIVDIKPTIEQLAQNYRNAKGCAVRLQKEANEAWLAAEKVKGELIDAGNKAGLVVTPHEAGGVIQSSVSYRLGEAGV